MSAMARFLTRCVAGLALTLATPVGAALSSNMVLPEILVVADDASTLEAFGGISGLPQNVVRVVTSRAKIVFFYTSMRVINPTKEEYEIHIECVDSGDRIVIDVRTTQKISRREVSMAGDKTYSIEARLGLDPRLGVLVPGQKIPLEGGGNYFVRIFVDDKLIGLSTFRYVVDPKDRH
jgi:hypothetical protein